MLFFPGKKHANIIRRGLHLRAVVYDVLVWGGGGGGGGFKGIKCGLKLVSHPINWVGGGPGGGGGAAYATSR